jgi:hypothetical protein
MGIDGGGGASFPIGFGGNGEKNFGLPNKSALL